MFYLDQDYSRRSRPDQPSLAELISAHCQREKIPFEVKELNPKGFGDVMWTGLDGIYSGEIKGASEILGSLDHAWGQLQRQMPQCDRAFLSIYGRIEPSEDGNCYVFTLSGNHTVWVRDSDAQVEHVYRRRYHRQNYKGYRRWLARRDQIGISIFESPDLESLAVQLVSQYVVATTESDSLNRLVTEKFILSEQDQARRDFMLTLMGIQNAGIGEEVADAITCWFEESNVKPSLRNLVLYFYEAGEALLPVEQMSFTKQPLRSSLREGGRKRAIGPAAVGKLKKALGV